MEIYGAIEAGGTKFNCAIGSSAANLSPVERIATTTPEETIRACLNFFKDKSREHKIRAIGIASFGPLDLNPQSRNFGNITTTPKPGWTCTPLRRAIAEGLALPVAIDTDVNGAALAEQRWGACQGLDQVLYLTVGTGIGGGALVACKPLHGLIHPEMGHIKPCRHPKDSFAGVCSYHGDCLEGLASGPALAARWRADPQQFPDDHPAWEIEAFYLAQAVSTYACVLSPQRIVIGGGVMHRTCLYEKVRAHAKQILNGYIDSMQLKDMIDSYIVAPQLGDNAGVLGAIALAQSVSTPN